MADYISREAAIEALCMNCQWIDQEDDKSACWCMEKDRFNRIPAADVRPVVKAHWIYHEDYYGDYYECSNCHGEYVVYEGDMFWKFCPTCGAETRAANDRPYNGDQ